MTREWGPWTREKLRILGAYLDAFASVAKSVDERVYLDAFAGEGVGVDRLTDEEFKGSARIALEVEPPFTRVGLFERPRRAAALQRRLREEFPDRDIQVYPGDCNDTIPEALGDLAPVSWAPAFAFLDPDGMELAWETLRALANHRKSKQGRRLEMWILFTTGSSRTLPLKRAATAEDLARATRLFGSDEWHPIYEARRVDRATAAEARWGYLNLLRWRLEKVLGYQWTHPLTMRDLNGRPIYNMVFATTHPVGDTIMRFLYDKAEAEIPERMLRLREERQGRFRLFEPDPPDGPKYVYEEPLDPANIEW